MVIRHKPKHSTTKFCQWKQTKIKKRKPLKPMIDFFALPWALRSRFYDLSNATTINKLRRCSHALSDETKHRHQNKNLVEDLIFSWPNQKCAFKMRNDKWICFIGEQQRADPEFYKNVTVEGNIIIGRATPLEIEVMVENLRPIFKGLIIQNYIDWFALKLLFKPNVREFNALAIIRHLPPFDEFIFTLINVEYITVTVDYPYFEDDDVALLALMNDWKSKRTRPIRSCTIHFMLFGLIQFVKNEFKLHKNELL